MDWLIRFFREQPLLLVVAVAWIAGIVGNVAKAAKKARERAEERTRGGRMPGPEPTIEPAPPADPRLPETTAESIEREMERLLRGGASGPDRESSPAGYRELPSEATASAPEPAPAPPPLPRRPLPIRRDVPEVERPPVPVVPTTGGPRLPRHVDPHVGESIQNRAAVGGRVGEHVLGQELGSLGGRVHDGPQRRVAKSRYALDDLKRVVVLNEILGPPLAMRGPHDRGL